VARHRWALAAHLWDRVSTIPVSPSTEGRLSYRGTLLIRNSPPPSVGSFGGGAVSYERGAPVSPDTPAVADLPKTHARPLVGVFKRICSSDRVGNSGTFRQKLTTTGKRLQQRAPDTTTKGLWWIRGSSPAGSYAGGVCGACVCREVRLVPETGSAREGMQPNTPTQIAAATPHAQSGTLLPQGQILAMAFS